MDWALACGCPLRERQLLLAASLSLAVSELQYSRDAEAARAALVRFHASYVGAGQVNHYIGLATKDGKVLLDAGKHGGSKEPLTASVPLMAPALAPDRLQVLMRQEDERFSADRARRWRAWAVHVGVTAIAVLLLLFIVIGREVTRPIQRCSRASAIWNLAIERMSLFLEAHGRFDGSLGGFARSVGNCQTVTRILGAQRRADAAKAEVASSPRGH